MKRVINFLLLISLGCTLNAMSRNALLLDIATIMTAGDDLKEPEVMPEERYASLKKCLQEDQGDILEHVIAASVGLDWVQFKRLFCHLETIALDATVTIDSSIKDRIGRFSQEMNAFCDDNIEPWTALQNNILANMYDQRSVPQAITQLCAGKSPQHITWLTTMVVRTYRVPLAHLYRDHFIEN